MEKEELRIGNLFIDRVGRICRVEALYENRIDFSAIKGATTSLPCTPIPLTEEWFLRLGFELGCEDWQMQIDDEFNYLLIDKDSFILSIGQDCIESVINRKIEYVHQAQNIYLDLKGS